MKSCFLGCGIFALLVFALLGSTCAYLGYKAYHPQSIDDSMSFFDEWSMKSLFKDVYGFKLKGKCIFTYSYDYAFDGIDEISVFDISTETKKNLEAYTQKVGSNERSEFDTSFYNLIHKAEYYAVEYPPHKPAKLGYLKDAYKAQKNTWGVLFFKEDKNADNGFVFSGFVYLPSISKVVYIHNAAFFN